MWGGGGSDRPWAVAGILLFSQNNSSCSTSWGWEGSGEVCAPFFFFLRVGFGQFADIHRRIPEGDARFWLLPGLFSPAPCGRAKDSPAIWPRSLTYNSKKAQNPQRRQGALSATSAGQIHCVLGSWGAGGPGPAPGPAVSGLRRGGLLSTRCLEPHCRLDRELGKMANGNKTSCAQGRSLGTTSPSGWTQETAAPTAPWP